MILRQIKRTDKAAMYAVGKAGGVEVIQIGRSPAGERSLPDGTTLTFEESESYPGDEQFGRKGWYYMPEQREAANRKFSSIA